MAIMGIINELTASGLLGGLTGLIGNHLKAKREMALLELKNKMEQAAWPERQKVREHEEKMRAGTFDHELKLHDLNAKARAEENENAIRQTELKNSGEGLVAALESDNLAGNEPQWCTALRTATRPILCFALLVLMALIFFFLDDAGRFHIAKAIIYMAVTAVLYYYGDRPSASWRDANANLTYKGAK